ncbi:MAG: hypothetical protein JO261_10920 [Alphaproteobacteria bacterium]|nr:hypothetical protein [Alphaproteobacteria bacterium]MBV9694198.1 hypothetical protein [Alphaproteobacteria bacterium]
MSRTFGQVCAISAALLAIASGDPACAAGVKAPGKFAARPTLYVWERTPTGEKVIYPVRNGVVDRQNPLHTKAAGWMVHLPVPQEYICVSYHGTGAQGDICGMKCDNGSGGYNFYNMNCNAEIFGGSYDFEFQY